jgi:hypothetical protein
VRDNKKADFRHFLNSSKLSIVAAKSVQVMSPYTSNASDSHIVLHTLWATYEEPFSSSTGAPDILSCGLNVPNEVFDIEFHFFSSSEPFYKLTLRFDGFFTMNPMCHGDTLYRA